MYTQFNSAHHKAEKNKKKIYASYQIDGIYEKSDNKHKNLKTQTIMY